MSEEEKFSRGMVVVAHADDAEWGCSGTVAKWCADGWQVVYVVCTDGSKGSDDPNMSSDALVRIRQQEQLNAGEVLGLLDVVFLGYEDSMLEPTLELRRDIAREIRRYKPDVVVVGLIGERGREVKEFIDDILGPEGLKRAVVIASPHVFPPSEEIKKTAFWYHFELSI